MIVATTSLVSIFNSFTAYNNTVNEVSSSQVQALNSALSVSGSSFGAFPPSTTSNFNVATACLSTSTSPTNQNKLFFAASMWWDFFICNSNFQYSTSFDGVTWEAATNIPGLVAGYTVGPYFEVQVVGSTIYLVISSHSTLRFQLGIGTLASGGTGTSPAGTITWTSTPAEVVTGAQPKGPIQIEVDGAGNQWVAVVQGATAIAIYERQACASGTASNNGWEPNACGSSANPTNYAPTASPNLGALSANANMISFGTPSTLSTTGMVLLYETGSATVPSTGTVAVITQNALASTAWNQMTLSGITDYSLTASSALFIGTTMYFAGLQNAATGQTTGNLKFWTLTLISMTAGTNTAEQTIESSTSAWQAALTSSGTTLALFDNPSSSTIQYYTSSTLGSIWNSPAITIESAETAINGFSPATGAFAVTWANAAPNIRFAALSTFTISNNSPLAVHVVDLYVYNPATNSLVAHYYVNSTTDLDYWVGQGNSMVVPVRFIWGASTSYLVTVGTDTGVRTQLTVTSPPVVTTTCPAGGFLSQTAPTQICTNQVLHIDSDVAFSTTAPTLVQNTFATFTSGTSGSIAFGSNLAVKDVVIVCEGQTGTSTLPGAPTDTLALTYASIASATQSTTSPFDVMSCWKAMSNAGGADTVTTGTYGATCTTPHLCTIFIQEVSGSDIALVASTTGTGTTAGTSLTMTSTSFTNTPLLMGFYQKGTAGTDTAGGSFTLANGETGSLLYLSEKSTSLTSASTTFPATVGTSSVWAGVGVVIVKATTAFSVTLGANTNYVFVAYIDMAAPTGGSQLLHLHQLDTGVTLLAVCMTGSQTLNNNACYTATDTTLYATVPAVAQSLVLWGTIKVGSTATTLLIEFGSTNSGTTNAETLKAGSFIEVTPAQ